MFEPLLIEKLYGNGDFYAPETYRSFLWLLANSALLFAVSVYVCLCIRGRRRNLTLSSIADVVVNEFSLIPQLWERYCHRLLGSLSRHPSDGERDSSFSGHPLELRDVTKVFRPWWSLSGALPCGGVHRAVDSLSVSIRRGMVFCVLGHNGVRCVRGRVCSAVALIVL